MCFKFVARKHCCVALSSCKRSSRGNFKTLQSIESSGAQYTEDSNTSFQKKIPHDAHDSQIKSASARRTFAVNILIGTLTATDRIQSLVTVGTLETGLVEGLEGKHTITRRTSQVNELDTGPQDRDKSDVT